MRLNDPARYRELGVTLAMKIRACVGSVFVLILLFFAIWWVVSSDYSDSALSGTYRLSQGGQESTLILRPNHSFQQELSQAGKTERAEGTWRRIGEGGLAFSKEFLVLSGQEPGPDGTAYGEVHKKFGFFISLALSQYHVLWYNRVDPSPDNAVYGTYAGDEQGVPTTLVLKPDHTFEQTIIHLDIAKHARGTWGVSRSGDILFSRAFLKTSGAPLTKEETATAWNPKGANLQVQIAVTSDSGVPTFQKRQRPW